MREDEKLKFFFHVRKKDWAAAGIFSFVYCALQGGFVFVFDWFSPWLLHRFAQTFQPGSQTPPETAQKISQLHLFLLQKRQPYLRLTYYLMVIVIVSYILYLIAARPRPFAGLLVGAVPFALSRLSLILLCLVPCGPGDPLGWYTGWRFEAEFGGRNHRAAWGPSADELLFWGWALYLLPELLWHWIGRRQTTERK